MSNIKSIIAELEKQKNPKNLKGMSNFGINTENALGISITTLRKIAKSIGLNTDLAIELWNVGYHESRILASMITDPKNVDKKLIETWVNDFNSWDLCDQCCNNLFRKTVFAIDYTFEWTESEREYVKRAGFVLIAVLSVHSKTITNRDFQKYFPIILKHSVDERNFVMKAVNWSLRQIGKRNLELNLEAIRIAENMSKHDSKSAKWIAKNALQEITSIKVKNKLKSINS